MERIEKKVDEGFGKKCFLLGRDKQGVKYWLEAPSWDCAWYWGFGYIKTYRENRYPSNAKDIDSHRHWDTFIVGKHEFYDHDKECFRISNEYIHHINANPLFNSTTLTYAESWELADLMKSFYTLKESARLFHTGSSRISKSIGTRGIIKDLDLEKRINEIELPKIFIRIEEMLTPTKVE